MTVHILKPGYTGSWFCRVRDSDLKDSFITPEQLKEVENSIDRNTLCSDCIVAASAFYKELVRYREHTKEEEKPNRYTILHNEQGKWQILRRNVDNTFWQVEVKDLGSRSNAITLMDALIKKDKDARGPATPVQ